MKDLRESRIKRACRMLAAAVTIVAMTSLALVAPVSASAQPLESSAAALTTQTVAPMVVGITPVSSHCAVKAQWVTYLKHQDSRLKFRVWFYTDSDETRQYCVKIYKVKPKKNKTMIGLDAYSIYGDVPSKRTRGSSLYIRVPAPKWFSSYAQARYGKIVYTWIRLSNG